MSLRFLNAGKPATAVSGLSGRALAGRIFSFISGILGLTLPTSLSAIDSNTRSELPATAAK